MINRKIVALCSALMLSACSKVPTGNVGVKVYLLGNDKGVDSEVLTPGRYWIGINQELYLFPTFTQTYTWDKDNYQQISFQTVEGLEVSSDVGIIYHVDPDKVTSIFQKYRKGIDEITGTYLRNIVRDSLMRQSSVLPIETVYGKGKSDLIQSVQEDVKTQVKDIGIIIEKIYFAGELRLPAAVTASINSKIQATQIAQQRQNEVATAKAEADKMIEAARGESESIKLKAIADADAIKIKGDALAQNPKVIELEAINKWNGTVPQIMGAGSVPFINMNMAEKMGKP
jgi:regulator of protease activity HflC (stomatin/prohibitin superfamily)